MGSSSAPLCSWMPCLPLASAVPTEAVDTGSPGENTRHCLVGTAEPNGLPVGCPPPSQRSQGHTEQQVPSPPIATAQCQGQLGQAPPPRLSRVVGQGWELGWALPQQPLHTRQDLTTVQEQLPQTEHPSPTRSRLLSPAFTVWLHLALPFDTSARGLVPLESSRSSRILFLLCNFTHSYPGNRVV